MGAIMFGAFIALLVLASRASASSSSPAPSSEPPKLPPGPLSPEDEEAQEQADIHEEIKADAKELPPNIISPLKDVTVDAWRKYVKLQRQAGLGTITKSYLLGMFLLGMRVLQDLAMAKNVRLQEVKLPDGKMARVFKGDFVPPLTQEIFLSDAGIQYQAFELMTVGHARYIRAKWADVIKEGHTTLSGLLGVAKQAGLAGMDKWLTEQTTRKESTTAAFKRVNGIF